MKRILQLFLLLFTTYTVTAQTYTPPAFAETDNNYRNYVNNVFGTLESNRVPTGLLMDYAFDFTDPRIYNGSVLVDSTLMEQGIYSELYKTIFTSRFNNNSSGMRHPSIHDSLCYVARQKEVITLSGLLFKYNAIMPDANTTGKMEEQNGQLYDVYNNGVWQNPYEELNTVAISPSIIRYKLTYCSVVLPSNLWLGNRNSDISSIQFDAGDGQGYRTLQFDVPVQLNYADTGWKHWVFRINLTNNQQLYSHTKVHFNNTSNMAGSGGGGIAARGVIDLRPPPITATEQFNGVFGVADIVISYRNANDQVIRRPLIVAEGLDPGHVTSPEEPEGESNFEGFIQTVRNSNSAALQGLISDDPSAYDIIYINWRNGTDWLQRNALVLEEVIREVNRLKQPLNGVPQQNVVLGSSMGGVIARMALGRMDRAGGVAAHDTRLYVSLDAPHQGANVPLGYQAAARHATRIYVSTGLLPLVEFVQLIRNGPSPLLVTLLADQPAARQLLIERIDLGFNEDNAPYQQFMQELQTQWAYPANIRNIAISNGNECAIDQEFAPGSTLIYHYRSTKTRFIGDLIFMLGGAILGGLTNSPFFIPFAIPGSNKFELTLDTKALANGGGNQVYYGNIKYTKKVLWLVPVSINIANRTYNAPSGLLPFDTYPGGFYTVSLANQPGSVSQDWMFSYDNSFFIQRRFAFIHTTSALDIGQGNTAITNTEYTARYIGATPPAPPFNTPFQNFTTAFNTDGAQWPFINSTTLRLNNEPHEWFFIRNANWLAAEMAINNPQPQATNCSAFCGNISIAGPDAVCNTGSVYSVPFVAGSTYTWSVDNPNLATIVANGNSATVTQNGSFVGTLQITVTVTSGECGTNTITKTVSVGSPYIAASVEGANPASPNGGYYYSLSLPPNITVSNIFWRVPAGWTLYAGQGTMQITVFTGTTGGDVEVSFDDACGVNRAFFKNVTIGEGGPDPLRPAGEGVTIYPNPASDLITVSLKESKTNTGFIKEIRIINKMGLTVQDLVYKDEVQSKQVNISALKPDVYTVQVYNNKIWQSVGLSKR
ncbi:MAG: hypothetical protein H0W75_01900 [Chitinophagaceae bacterium]|nr:hypothetical protein [Chitinophagaceae bacterium]